MGDFPLRDRPDAAKAGGLLYGVGPGGGIDGAPIEVLEDGKEDERCGGEDSQKALEAIENASDGSEQA
jgi:hypothetical protein